MVPETFPSDAVVTVPDLPHGFGGQGSTIRQSGKVSGPLLPAELEQVFQFPQDIDTANAVAGNMRHPEAGLPAIMHDNTKGLEHDIITPPANPEVRQKTCARNMQPVEPAPDPYAGFIHVDDLGTNQSLPDMLIKLAETAGLARSHVDDRPFRRFHAEQAGQGPGQALHRNQLVLAGTDHKSRQVRAAGPVQ